MKRVDSIENRNVRDIERQILNLTGVERNVIATIEHLGQTYPIYSLVTPPHSDPSRIKNVLLTGGVHGDEPAGVFSLLAFLELHAEKYLHEFRFFVIPQVNPVGFHLNTLENGKLENINRSFAEEIVVEEALAVAKQLKLWNTRFEFAIDMHEIPDYWVGEGWTEQDNPRSAYLYETQVDVNQRIGPFMMGRLPRDIEICDWPRIYADAAEGGVVTYPEGNNNVFYAQGTSLDAFVQRNYSRHTFTSETPISWPLEKRVRTHLGWLTAALEAKGANA